MRTAAREIAMRNAPAKMLAACLLSAMTVPAAAQTSPPVVLAAQTRGTPEQRAAAMLAQMTRDEKLTLLKGYFGTDFPPARFEAPDEARYGSAGYVPGIPRLGIPPQWQADAGIGVATQGGAAEKRARTALPSGLAVAATWDLALARAGGAMIGAEARADGFNVLLAGSVNLLREPRNGRNFEYAGEDPLLAGTIVGAAIAGIQSNGIISTVKHYAVNDQETDRGTGNSVIAEPALRMSDLLAFQFAIERGDPGSAMCAYNKVNGTYSCEHPFLLTQVLRGEWRWPGYVLSDWGAVHSTAASANAGLDQESGFGLQRDDWFGADKLRAALAAGQIDDARIDLMAGRILRSMFAHGLIDRPVAPDQPIDFAAHRAISRAAAEAGIVLLKNERGVLPLLAGAGRIAVIGGHADKGVLSGGGSSQVYPEGTNAVPGIAPTTWPGPVVYYPSSPLEELRKLLPGATFTFDDGVDPESAVRAAAGADVAIVFGTQWASESIDVAPALSDSQDTLIESVALANRNTVVVLETGGPVLMPWADRVPAILAAWYPGRAGGEAIARVLTGAVNPSGHLPATFPKSLDQLPWPGEPRRGDVAYTEGAAVGYKWFDAQRLEPLFPFGHGLSYTTFRHDHLAVAREGDGLFAMVEVTNTGTRAGADVVQVYVSGRGWEAPRRLGGFAKVALEPGERKRIEIHIDPRLLGVWFEGRPGWTHPAGAYTVSVGHSSRDLGESVIVELPASYLAPEWRP
ncbi:MAG: glycosyl hydrolase [Sphingomonadales bacterium 32-68-7]|nr:MAG: glycosyl hydrolase [Sphingomonadales bacterium 12-68-11]OYX09718.1 MAG: glycosyl hydrolase [Sphingomonadales bacterium 32-68-7]